MINFSFNLANLSGLVLIGIAGRLLIFTMKHSPFSAGKALLALAYFVAGFILMFYGWRFEWAMQLSQIILVGSIGWLTEEFLRG